MEKLPGVPNFNATTYVSSNKRVSNVADALTQLTDTTSTIVLEGFYEKDDVEYGLLQYFETSTLPHDGGLVIDPKAPSPSLGLDAYLSYVSTTPGRWIRKSGDQIPVEWYGAKKNDEEFDNILSIKKAIESPNTKGKEIIFAKGFYVIKSAITISIQNVTLSGSGKYDTFIVGYKSGVVGGALDAMVRINPGADNTTIKYLGFKTWNYPSRHEAGWTDRFKFTGEGRIVFADNVRTINRGINGGDPSFFELDLSDAATRELFPPHWYVTTTGTKAGFSCGGIVQNTDTFKSYYRTITIAPSQSSNIVDTFTATNLPAGFDMETWNLNVRIVHTGSVAKGGSTIPSSNSAAMLPTGYDNPAVEIDITADAVYNYDGTFTVTFKFASPVSSNFSGLASSNISGGNYILPYALDLWRGLLNLTIDNVFIDGLWYAGPVNTENGATNKIGSDDMIGLYAVKNVTITNSNFENYTNDGISMKDVFDAWGPSIQTRSINNNIIVKNTVFRKGGKSGVDIEGSDIIMEGCKFIDTLNLGALRIGSRAYGVIQNEYLFKDCECSLDPKLNTSGACSIQRFLGLSSVKKVVYDNCTFFLPPYISSPINVTGILISTTSPDLLIIKNCTFNKLYRTMQINTNINNIVISDCQTINTNFSGGSIIYAAVDSVLKGPIIIRNYYFERKDGLSNELIDGFSSVKSDKNLLIRCDVVLSETDTLSRSLISYNMFRTFFNSINSVTTNIIENNIIDTPWTITIGLGANLTNASVDTATQKYKYVGKNVVMYFKLTADVTTSGAASSFTFALPVLIASGVTSIYGTCTSLSSTSSQSVGAVVYNSTSLGRVRINPSGSGTTTFWVKCEYEF